MTCQRMGRYPTGTIGLGTVSEYSRSLIPMPPQKRTTLIHPPLKRVARKPYVAALRKRSATSCEWNYTPILVLHIEGPSGRPANLEDGSITDRPIRSGFVQGFQAPVFARPVKPQPSVAFMDLFQ